MSNSINPSENYSKSKKEFIINLIISSSTLIAVTGSIIINIYQTYKFKFYENKIQTYVELVAVTGRLSSENTNFSEFNKLKKDFYSLYFGKSQLFEDKNHLVKKRIVDFKVILEKINTTDSITFGKNNFTQLKEIALSLSSACSAELNK